MPCACVCTTSNPHDLDFSPGLRMPRICNPCAIAFARGQHRDHHARGFPGWPPSVPCEINRSSPKGDVKTGAEYSGNYSGPPRLTPADVLLGSGP